MGCTIIVPVVEELDDGMERFSCIEPGCDKPVMRGPVDFRGFKCFDHSEIERPPSISTATPSTPKVF